MAAFALTLLDIMSTDKVIALYDLCGHGYYIYALSFLRESDSVWDIEIKNIIKTFISRRMIS